MSSPHITEPASFYIWLHRGLFLGTYSLPQREYTVSTDQLIVCLEGSIKVKPEAMNSLVDPVQGKPRPEFRSALLRAGTTVKMSMIDTRDAVIAKCYLNPLGYDFFSLKEQMLREFLGSYYQYRNEEQLIQQLRYIRDNKLTGSNAYRILDGIITPLRDRPLSLPSIDPRIIRVMKLIHATVRSNISIGEMADSVHICESRLFRLFKDEIGIPITKYRTHYRTVVGMIYMALGYSITDSALAAGFSSPAHFSKCFSKMTGMPPSNKYLRPPYMNVIVDNEILETIDYFSPDTNVL